MQTPTNALTSAQKTQQFLNETEVVVGHVPDFEKMTPMEVDEYNKRAAKRKKDLKKANKSRSNSRNNAGETSESENEANKAKKTKDSERNVKKAMKEEDRKSKIAQVVDSTASTSAETVHIRTSQENRPTVEEIETESISEMATDKLIAQYGSITVLAQQILEGDRDPKEIGNKVLKLAQAMLEENHKLIKKIREMEKKAQSQPAARIPTFAEITRSQRSVTDSIRTIPKKAQHVVLVRPKSDIVLKTSEMTKESIMSTINPEKERISIQNVRKISKNGILIETNTEEQLDKFLNNNALKKKFTIEIPKKRNPKIIIYDVPKDIEANELGVKIIRQNRDLEITEEEFQEDIQGNFIPRFRTGPRRDLSCNWVVEVSPEVRKFLLEKGRVYIGWNSCRARDYIIATKCYKCQGLGHVAKHCNRETVTCGHCAEDGHAKKDCTKKQAGPVCAVCVRAKKPSNHAGDAGCPLYSIAIEKAKQMTDYGQTS